MVVAIEELYTELGYSEELAEQSRRWAGEGRGTLIQGGDWEDEELIAGLRGALARLASAAQRGEGADGAPDGAVLAALDGAELVMRGEILLGNGGRLAALVPSFAFLATLPVIGRERALDLSRRAEKLLEVEGG
jgi:hypothetical protein